MAVAQIAVTQRRLAHRSQRSFVTAGLYGGSRVSSSHFVPHGIKVKLLFLLSSQDISSM